MKRNALLVITSIAPLLFNATLAGADEPCSTYPTGTAEKIQSPDLEKTFGPVPAPKKPLRFAYVTKTLINEFWQDVAAGIKSEAAKYNIQVDVQAPNVESGEQVAERITTHRWLQREQTIITSSCGFNHLPRHIALGKLRAMAEAKAILTGAH